MHNTTIGICPTGAPRQRPPRDGAAPASKPKQITQGDIKKPSNGVVNQGFEPDQKPTTPKVIQSTVIPEEIIEIPHTGVPSKQQS